MICFVKHFILFQILKIKQFLLKIAMFIYFKLLTFIRWFILFYHAPKVVFFARPALAGGDSQIGFGAKNCLLKTCEMKFIRDKTRRLGKLSGH